MSLLYDVAKFIKFIWTIQILVKRSMTRLFSQVQCRENDRDCETLSEKRLVLSDSRPFSDRIYVMSNISLDAFLPFLFFYPILEAS